jgi:hypothetical protein
MNRKIYTITGVAIVILYVLIADCLHLMDVIGFAGRSRWWEDEYSVYEKRFKDIKRHIPENTPISYITESTTTYGHDLAQYALAPTIVLNHASKELIVGDFADTSEINKYNVIRSLKVIENCRNGVVLFKR